MIGFRWKIFKKLNIKNASYIPLIEKIISLFLKHTQSVQNSAVRKSIFWLMFFFVLARKKLHCKTNGC